jgi:tetratricopeptide (TPR) repeat protein
MQKAKIKWSDRFFKGIIAFLLLFLGGCVPNCPHQMDPVIVCAPPVYQISQLPNTFPPLSDEEKQQEWGKELVIGDVFAREWDLYRAITCYKRALILIPQEAVDRRLQLYYDLILAYYLGNKYQEVITLFEEGELSQADSHFPAFNHLLVMLYDSYQQVHIDEKAACVMQAIQKYSPETAEDLLLYTFIKTGELEAARKQIEQHRESEALRADLDFYDQYAKSPQLARRLNAILPGAGYYYVGQKRSAITSFLINTLFVWASYEFFNRGYTAAGCITSSLEAGWYLGGINGAGIEAHEFNTRLYEGVGKKMLNTHSCFPLLMFETSF